MVKNNRESFGGWLNHRVTAKQTLQGNACYPDPALLDERVGVREDDLREVSRTHAELGGEHRCSNAIAGLGRKR